MDWTPDEETLQELSERFGISTEEVQAKLDSAHEKYLQKKQRDAEIQKQNFLRLGIDYKCHCTEDALAGRMVMVPVCQLELIEALAEALNAVNIERDALQIAIDELRLEVESLEAQLDAE